MGQNFFSSFKLLLFETFVSIDLLGLQEMILSFVQKLSIYLVDFIKCSLTFVMFDFTREN